MIISSNKKVYEKPNSGDFIGVIADVVDLGIQPVTFKGETKMQPRVRVVWILDKNDSEGNPYRVMNSYHATTHERGNFYKFVRSVLGEPPCLLFESDTLIGHSNKLFLIKEKNDKGVEWVNIAGILPLPEGTQPLTVPANFVRNKDRKDNPAFQPRTQVQTPQPVAAAQAAVKAIAASVDETEIEF